MEVVAHVQCWALSLYKIATPIFYIRYQTQICHHAAIFLSKNHHNVLFVWQSNCCVCGFFTWFMALWNTVFRTFTISNIESICVIVMKFNILLIHYITQIQLDYCCIINVTANIRRQSQWQYQQITWWIASIECSGWSYFLCNIYNTCIVYSEKHYLDQQKKKGTNMHNLLEARTLRKKVNLMLCKLEYINVK